MRPIAPRLGDAFDEIAVAEDQPEFKPVTMARVFTGNGSWDMVGRWTLTPEERQRIAAGDDIYITFPRHTFPHSLGLRPDWATP